MTASGGSFRLKDLPVKIQQFGIIITDPKRKE
jgi:hypothetical protein